MGFIFGGGKKESAPPPPPPAPTVDDTSGDTSRDKMRKVGRAALIASTPQGVLGNASTGRNKLLA